jgi:hypothetical protein
LPCTFDQPYRFSGKFKYVINSHNRHLFDEHHDLLVPPDDVNEGSNYRTVFGPQFTHKFVPLKSDDRGLVGAVRRLTQVREPLKPGVHEQLSYNQTLIRARLDQHLTSWMDHVKNDYADRLSDTDPSSLYHTWVTTAMPKRELRISATIDILDRGKNCCYASKVAYKVKTGEVLPRNKYLRGIADIGTPGSTRGAYIIPPLKLALHRYETDDILCVFVASPLHQSLVDSFQTIWDAPKRVTMVCFSDDSMISVRVDGEVRRYNMDIRNCDGSIEQPIFSILQEVMDVDSRYTDDVHGLFDQLHLPLKLRFKSYNRSIRLKSDQMSLYSGSALTTVVDTVGNICIALSVLRESFVTDIDHCVERGAFNIGFLVKCFPCYRIEDLQFLKHSPCYTVDGHLSCVLNLAVFLKTAGSCRGELPGSSKMGVLNRGALYTSEVVRSYLHAGDCSFYDCVRDRFIVGCRLKLPKHLYIEHRGFSAGRLCDESLMARYGFNAAEYDELLHVIRTSRQGYACISSIVDRVIEKDYG